MTLAYLLVSHGSRDPRSQLGVDRLADLVRQKLALKSPDPSRALAGAESLAETGASAVMRRSRSPLVGSARLEGDYFTLAQQIIDFALEAIAQDYSCLVILPLFLVPGLHVQEDIPAEIARAQVYLRDRIPLILNPYLGSHGGMQLLLAASFAELPQTTRILLSHGTKKEGGTQAIETIAHALNAHTAYWSIAPSLTEQVTALIAQGQDSIAILPYFLFEGGITDAIAETVTQLRQSFPQSQIQLGHPLGATPALADVIIGGMIGGMIGGIEG